MLVVITPVINMKDYKKMLIEIYDKFTTTEEIPIPKDPFDRIIGQERAVRIAKIVATQKRHLLLVGPPGTGKSLIARAMASILKKPKQQISVLNNPERPERPILKIENYDELAKENSKRESGTIGKIIDVREAPIIVTEELGYRCKRCGELSSPNSEYCHYCGARKSGHSPTPFDDLFIGFGAIGKTKRIKTNRTRADGKQEVLIYEVYDDEHIKVMSEKDLKVNLKKQIQKGKKVLVPINRSLFVQVAGASESELLGDVQHDPYGGHPEIGIPPYLRVVPGAVHEAHEGVLFIDELSVLNYSMQKSILTAMQDKKFPITGRNSTSTGAIVKVDDVPCDFILVGAINVNDVNRLTPALRSRIRGDGYEVLIDTNVKDTKENRAMFAQFVAQEIQMDGKIPHASREAVLEIIRKAKQMAKEIDNTNGLTLRLRALSGLIKLSGDMAKSEGSKNIEKKHVKEAMKYSMTIEEQLYDKYDNWWKAGTADYITKNKPSKDIS